MIQTGQTFDKYVGSFVIEFITAGGKKIQRFIQIKVIMSGIQKVHRKVECDTWENGTTGVHRKVHAGKVEL